MKSLKEVDWNQRIIIALDFPEAKVADSFLKYWDGLPKPFIKVGYQLFFQAGSRWVAQKKEEGYSVFLDLKLHDIPQTVAKGIESLSHLGVDFLTIHASGGRAMIEAAREQAEKAACRPKLLAVTQLTSTDQYVMNHEIGILGSVQDTVIRYTRLAYTAGADGVICSGLEVQKVKQESSPTFLAVTPGIRPQNSQKEDQKRVVTPAEAWALGADYLVVGRPITQALDPLKVYQALIEEIKQVGRNPA